MGGRFIAYLFSLGGFACLASAAAVWTLARPRSTTARRTLLSIVFVYTLASMGIVPWALSRPLLIGVRSFPLAGDGGSANAAIVLLGSGSFTVHGYRQRLGLLDEPGAARVLEAARVFRLLGSPWIISSGGAAPGIETEPSAATMRQVLIQLGVPADRILLETESQTTRDEAVMVAPMVKTLRVDRVVLVTSETHMRRSLAAFRAVGVDAAPAPAKDPVQYQSLARSILPGYGGLEFSSAIVHEYVGLLYYFARGWLR